MGLAFSQGLPLGVGERRFSTEKEVACAQNPLSPQAKEAERGGEVSLLSLSLLLLISSLPPLKSLVLRLGTPSPISLDLTLVPIHFGEYK